MISVKWSWETITINTELLCSVNLQQQYLARLDTVELIIKQTPTQLLSVREEVGLPRR